MCEAVPGAKGAVRRRKVRHRHRWGLEWDWQVVLVSGFDLGTSLIALWGKGLPYCVPGVLNLPRRWETPAPSHCRGLRPWESFHPHSALSRHWGRCLVLVLVPRHPAACQMGGRHPPFHCASCTHCSSPSQPCGRSLNSILGKSNLKFAGMPITLTISTSSLNLMASDCKQVRAG